MRRVIFSIGLALCISGCASSHKGRAVQTVVISDGVADEVGDGWDTFVVAQIDICESKLGNDATKEQKAECMGAAGKGEQLEAAVQSLIAVQVAIKEAVKCEEIKACPKEVDWKELKTEILSAWQELQPYVKAVGGK